MHQVQPGIGSEEAAEAEMAEVPALLEQRLCGRGEEGGGELRGLLRSLRPESGRTPGRRQPL